MKNTFFAFMFLALLSSCNNDLVQLDIPKKCFPPASFLKYSGDENDIKGFMESYPSIFYPNCITPNGDGINDVFDFVASNGDIEFETEDFKFYTKKNKLITERDDSKWDGKLSDGTIVNDVYGFSVDIVLSNQNKITAFGSFCVRKCFNQDDDLNQVVFGDQIHPRLGVIYPTQEEAVYCE